MPTKFPPTNCNPHPSRSSDGLWNDEVSVNPNLLLNRLVNVKSTGDQQWRACCPVHESKSKSSLSIRQVEDGRILIYCHGGCEPLEILKVCGLEMTDLMPERITHNATPAEKRKWRQAATMREWEKARATIQHEARVIWVAGKQIQDGKPLNDVDDKRMDEALEQITIQVGKLDALEPRTTTMTTSTRRSK